MFVIKKIRRGNRSASEKAVHYASISDPKIQTKQKQ